MVVRRERQHRVPNPEDWDAVVISASISGTDDEDWETSSRGVWWWKWDLAHVTNYARKNLFAEQSVTYFGR